MSTDRLLQKPLFGGVFGHGEYALVSMPCITHGLHAVRFMVVQPQGGLVLSVAEDKVEALARARERLQAANDARAPLAPVQVQGELWPEEPLLHAAPAPAAYVSRRRRDIFERSHGRCAYCDEPLDITGRWHVEHQFPRALGGTDDALNLVAACTRCNLAKSDRTALEFMAADSQGTQAVR